MLRKFLALMLLAAAALPFAASAAGNGVGTVFAMTNALEGNEIVVYDRSPEGVLTLRESVPTGGLGVGATTEPVDALGSQNPLVLSRDGRWLFAVNAGSDEISVFAVRAGGITLVDKVHSGGAFPASLTVDHDLLYVLNSGGEANITGFSIAPDGHLTPLAGSTRSLDVGGDNPPFFLVSPAQVGFSPRGDSLLVTIKGSNEIRVFAVDANGLPAAQPVSHASNGTTPFGFAFDRHSRLLVVEAFGTGQVGDAGAGAVSSYEQYGDTSLEVITGSLGNFQTASCWLVVRGGFAYVTNNASDTISGYRIAPDGTLSLLDAGGVSGLTGHAPVDLAVTRNGRFLYNVNAGAGTVSMFAVDPSDGRLTALGEVAGLPVEAGAVGIAAR